MFTISGSLFQMDEINLRLEFKRPAMSTNRGHVAFCGSGVGLAVGEEVRGGAVRTSVGASVGKAVGDAVGVLAVGAFVVGLCVGKPVVGLAVGKAVGDAVGALGVGALVVGLCVGKPVGA